MEGSDLIVLLHHGRKKLDDWSANFSFMVVRYLRSNTIHLYLDLLEASEYQRLMARPVNDRPHGDILGAMGVRRVFVRCSARRICNLPVDGSDAAEIILRGAAAAGTNRDCQEHVEDRTWEMCRPFLACH